MATYDYRCEICEVEKEINKPMSEAFNQELCPNCGSEMDKQMSAPAFHLKGTGWYVTDYKKKSGKKDKKDVPSS